MALRYEIKEGLVVLGMAASGFDELRGVLEAITSDPDWFPKMPLVFDLLGEPPEVRYTDVALRLEHLSKMRELFGPRWAVLIGPGPVRAGVWRMLSLFREREGLEVALFGDWDTAVSWLVRAPEAETFEFRVYVGSDELGSFAALRRRGEALDVGVSWRLVGATDDEGLALGFLGIAEEESEAANRE